MVNSTKLSSDILLDKTDTTRIEKMRDYFTEIRNQIGRKIIGQDDVVEQLMISFFAGGHTLFIGVPGLAKTLLVRTLSEVLGLNYNRIQFTPDLMPSDITGSDIIGVTGEGDREFNFLPGPLFTNIVLADEINRTPPKTQAALLEAMEEYTIHVGGRKYDVPKPFFVLATQNPIEQEGTYTLPAAAQDRFMFNIFVDYPDNETEKKVVEVTTSREEESLKVVLEREEIVKILELVRRFPISEELMEYAVALTRYTRPDESPSEIVREWVAWGASPRASQSLILGAKARAILHGRTEAKPEDIRAIAQPILRHRMMANFHAESEGVRTDDVIKEIIKQVPRPSGDVSPEEEIRKIKRKKKFFLTKWLWEPETSRTKEENILLEKALAPSKLTRIIEAQQEGTFTKRPVMLAGLLLGLFGLLLLLTSFNLFKGDVSEVSGIFQILLILYSVSAGISGFSTIFNKNKIHSIFQKFSSFSLILLIPGVIGTLLTAAIIKLSSVVILIMLLAALISFVLLLLNPE